MRLQVPVAALCLTACLISTRGEAVERATVSTLSGTVARIRPASPVTVKKLTAWQQWLEGLKHKEEPLTLDLDLQDGDGLRSLDGESAVMLECASGATQTLKGPFDVILRIRADGKGCKIEVRDGQVTATTAPDPEAMPDGRPEQQYGDVTLGASSTMFGLAVSDDNVECFVIDGAITATRANQPAWTLAAGQQLAVNTQALTAISEARLERVANTYARLDVVALPAQERLAKQAQLRNDYLVAFRKPEDAEARARLIQSYSVLKTAPNAAGAYQVRKESVLKQRAIDRGAIVQPGMHNPAAIAQPQPR